jgi:hypothetical protein
MKAATTHFLVTVVVAALAAVLVFFVWYPWPFYEIVAGRELFWLVIGVDVVCGPLLTLVLWNPAKSARELALDMSMIGLIQIAALAYGMSTVTDTRPVRLVFEVDRIRLVSASEVEPNRLAEAPEALRSLPWTGPVLVGIRPPKDNQEMLQSIDLSLAGLEPSLRPGWWQTYAESVPEVLKAARPLADLRVGRPESTDRIDKAIRAAGRSEEELLWLPLTGGRSFDWIVLIHGATAQPLAYAPIDGFL